MPFCPKCRDKFQDWVESCPDCKVKLVARLTSAETKPQSSMKGFTSNNLVTIATFDFPEEAHLSQAKLESRGIQSFVADEFAIRANNMRGVRLQVKESEIDKAIKILQEEKKNKKPKS